MKWRIIILPAILTLLSGAGARAQHQRQTPSDNPSAPAVGPAESPRSENIPLTVPKGMAIQVIIDKEGGQSWPADSGGALSSRPTPSISSSFPPEPKSRGKSRSSKRFLAAKRTLEALNADLSLSRKVAIQFDTIALADGKCVALKTMVTPGSGQVIEFVSAAKKKSKRSASDIASEKAAEAENQA
jgi:hypothetical protein